MVDWEGYKTLKACGKHELIHTKRLNTFSYRKFLVTFQGDDMDGKNSHCR